ncbi:MAG: hypothetical protein ACP5OB_05530 [Candidatus Ratteibacteria bacterium]
MNFDRKKNRREIKNVEKSRISGSGLPGYKLIFLKMKPTRKQKEIIE